MDDAARGGAHPADAAGPLDALLYALRGHDTERTHVLLAPDVRLTVPPLRIDVRGRDAVAVGLLDVASAFDGIGYDLRGRYLTPDTVTDETALSGTHVRDLLGAPPTHRYSRVPARLIAAHDGAVVTRLDIWPDVSAVRDICEEVARYVDQHVQGAASAMVTALRATIPVTSDPRVVHGRTREVSDPSATPFGELAVAAPSDEDGVLPEASPGRTDGTRLPVTRQVRRRRALIGGAAMLTASAALVTWIADGALNTPGGSAVVALIRPTPTAAPTVDPTRAPSPTQPAATAAGPSPTVSKQPFTLSNNQFDVNADFLFETGKATLTPKAAATLADIIESIIDDRRFGTIVVSGYTDNVGSEAFNLRLSRQRANAVATVLRRGLPGWVIRAQGYGMSNPRATNDTPTGRELNRRVSIKVPPRDSPSPPPSPSASPTRSTAPAATSARPKASTARPSPSTRGTASTKSGSSSPAA